MRWELKSDKQQKIHHCWIMFIMSSYILYEVCYKNNNSLTNNMPIC